MKKTIKIKRLLLLSIVSITLLYSLAGCGKKKEEEPISSINESAKDPELTNAKDKVEEKNKLKKVKSEDEIMVTIEDRTFPVTITMEEFYKIIEEESWTITEETKDYKVNFSTPTGLIRVSFMANEDKTDRVLASICVTKNSFPDPSRVCLAGVRTDSHVEDIEKVYPLESKKSMYEFIVTDYVKIKVTNPKQPDSDRRAIIIDRKGFHNR